jgi:hypothetical protein
MCTGLNHGAKLDSKTGARRDSGGYHNLGSSHLDYPTNTFYALYAFPAISYGTPATKS